ncbi:MAG: hypothetical protein Q4G16_10490 [Cruoricaptor ignavus]|nr:hypothetical protein [Cruoricaptor ignavus]
MKTLIFLISIMAFVVCQAQTTYSEEILKQKSEEIISFSDKSTSKLSNERVLVKDILDKLIITPIEYSATPDSNEYEQSGWVKYIVLKFYKRTEFRYKMDNKIKLYNIYIYLKEPIHESKTFTFVKKTKGKWSKEVADFFANIEVKNVKIYDLER